MKLLVAGSRGWKDFSTMKGVLFARLKQGPIDLIISGGAKGPDTYAIVFVNDLKIDVKVFKPDWSLGRGAGHIRNRDMAKEADELIAFWDGHSPGTEGMIDEMRRLKKPVKVVRNIY